MSYSAGAQPWGDCILYPCSTWWRTSAFVMPGRNVSIMKVFTKNQENITNVK